ncbi:MAG: N-acetylmuramoyl-L-alanine amidase [Gammaproteobacteria bacterium]
MKRILHFALVLGIFLSSSLWAQAHIQAVRVWPSPESTRIVLDLSAPVTYQAFTLENPHRVVLDIDEVLMKANTSQISWQKTPVATLRHSPRVKQGVRVVLDTHSQVRINSFLLAPNEEYGHRLVIDLYSNTSAPPIAQAANAPSQQLAAKPVTQATPPSNPPTTVAPSPPTSQAVTGKVRQRKFIVAIDAGHGGEDPGASGARGTKEKHVVLAIAKELQILVNKEPGMQAYLTRGGDYFVPLRTRIDKARAAQADLFISIHADAFKDRRAHGASVFTLSEGGASSEAARWIAEQENRSDLVGGVSMDDKDKMLASVLLDLSQTASNEASLTLGDSVLNQIKTIAPLHGSKHVQQAGFLVLKSPDIPSILVETEFISNPSAEQKLISKQYQQQVARAVMQGIRNYYRSFSGYHEQLTLTVNSDAVIVTNSTGGTRQHTIRNGDTLSTIAQQYGISVARLKQHNNLSGDTIRTGQVLQIPT